MKFVEIVETVEELESKLATLTESKLNLLESMLEEGVDTKFDVLHHIDYLVEFVEAQTDENAEIIAETVDCGEVLNIVLESVRENASDSETAMNEAMEKVADIEIDTSVVDDEDTETASVTLLSVVTNTLTEMLDEETVEKLPAEMVFDIVEEAKNLDISDDAEDMTLVELVEEISEKLEEAINAGEIDFDSEDYETETLAEFLNDYEDTEDLLEEMAQINDEILAEAEDQEGAELMRKAKDATTLIEATMEKCTTKKCQMKKAKEAKAYYMKNGMPDGGNIEDIKLNKLHGKLKKYVTAAAKASRKRGKNLSPDYLQYILVPGIIKRMRVKNKHIKAAENKLKAGMKAVK